ncbi:MAG TPA: hypothetical protein VFH72_14505 [Candidatus Baltobacteraceae bacterium]|jgi:hypothetical protein|nr:hypothetical protein [Candidatus Baltobacteraceae bacterium]
MKRQIAALGMAAALGCSGAASASNIRDGGVIRNSGSTNFSGYTIKVWSDGSTWAVHSNRAGTPIDRPVTGHIPEDLARRFLDDAKQARKNGDVSQPCMKSASFGTSTVVSYHGWTSPDLECPGGGFIETLGQETHKIAALLKIEGVQPRRIPRLPNEPRRVPSDSPSGQPSATPEPATSTS